MHPPGSNRSKNVYLYISPEFVQHSCLPNSFFVLHRHCRYTGAGPRRHEACASPNEWAPQALHLCRGVTFHIFQLPTPPSGPMMLCQKYVKGTARDAQIISPVWNSPAKLRHIPQKNAKNPKLNSLTCSEHARQISPSTIRSIKSASLLHCWIHHPIIPALMTAIKSQQTESIIKRKYNRRMVSSADRPPVDSFGWRSQHSQRHRQDQTVLCC